LIFSRIAGVAIQAPLFASPHIPTPLKVGFIAVISLIFFWRLPIDVNSISFDLTWILFTVAKEFLIGLIMGYVMIFILYSIQGAGALLDQQLGLSTGASFDPQLGAVNMNARFFFYFAFTIFILNGGFYFILKAIDFSFNILPVASYYNYSKDFIQTLISITNLFFYIALHVGGAVLVAVFIGQVGLGLIARVAPQSNVFMLSFPVNFMIGLFILSLTIPYIIELFNNNYLSYDYLASWISDSIKSLK
ncbi:MAG: flagellar biosynthetic protein FliR, partial [bacterium]